MDDDCWLPGLTRRVSPLAHTATLTANGRPAPVLRDGMDRDREHEPHAWTGPAGSCLDYRWPEAVQIGGARLVFDSNLAHEKRMPFTYPQRGSRCLVPSSLTRRFRLEALEETGRWRVIFREGENYQRLVHVPLGVCAKGLRLVAEETWGDDAVRLFAFEPSERDEGKRPAVPDGPHFSEVRAKAAPEDLLPPENGLESITKSSRSA